MLILQPKIVIVLISINKSYYQTMKLGTVLQLIKLTTETDRTGSNRFKLI